MKAQAGVNTLTQRHCKPHINMYTDGPYTRKYVQPRARKYSQRKYIARNTKDEHNSEATTLPVHLKGHGSPDQSSGGSFDGFRALSLSSTHPFSPFPSISFPSIPFPPSPSQYPFPLSLSPFRPLPSHPTLPSPFPHFRKYVFSLFPPVSPSLFPLPPPFPLLPVSSSLFPSLPSSTQDRAEGGGGATLSPARDQRPLWYGMV